MDEYSEALNRYYSEKNSGKKCKGCKNHKVFQEKDDTLSFSCGDGPGSQCSEGFKISLAKYINYKDTLHEYSEFVKKDPTESEEKEIKDLQEILSLSKKQITEKNQFSLKKKKIIEYEDLKINTKIEQTKILHDLTNDQLSDSDKDGLLKRYFSLHTVLNDNYKSLAELCDSPINNYAEVDKGSVQSIS